MNIPSSSPFTRNNIPMNEQTKKGNRKTINITNISIQLNNFVYKSVDRYFVGIEVPKWRNLEGTLCNDQQL